MRCQRFRRVQEGSGRSTKPKFVEGNGTKSPKDTMRLPDDDFLVAMHIKQQRPPQGTHLEEILRRSRGVYWTLVLYRLGAPRWALSRCAG